MTTSCRERSILATSMPYLITMNRALLFSLFLLSSLVAATASADSRPNVLFIIADDLGYEALGSYGGQDFDTPRLDAFAAQSTRLTRCYGSAVCTPSRMSLYTGNYVINHGYRSVLPVHQGTKQSVDFSKLKTLPESFRKAGYRTATTGKWQLAALEHHPHHIRSGGFDSWCVWQIWKDGAKTTRYDNPCFNQDGKIRDDISERFGPDVLGDYVINEMKIGAKTGQPFYIHHNMLLPHWPILPTPDDRAGGDDKGSLASMIHYMDKKIGELFDALDKLELTDNTWVIFIGDNGTDSTKPRSTDQGKVNGGKHHLVEGGIHLPAMIRGPGMTSAAVFDDLVDIADFYPTICELANVPSPAPGTIDGVSCAPQLRGESTAPARNFVTAAYGEDDCIFDGEWRLHRKGDVLWDCRNLPREIVVKTPTKESNEARARLSKIRDAIKR
ncbi:sulfatase-like hydrolase/transferase [Verrucomicrobiales bacterium BCK34]|nr:sulfatase-like hydrolase/transferase [Verrucomicrobiales bacterium BCK34]